MLTVPQFYARTRWGEQFATRDTLHPAGKTGMDIEWPTHEAIPTPFNIRIIGNNISDILGYTSTGIILDGKYKNHFISFRHITTPLGRLNTIIRKGRKVAYIAGPKDHHGTAWTGPHLDLSFGHTPHIWAGLDVENPAPAITYATVTP